MKYTTVAQLCLPCLVTAKLGEYRLVDSRYRQAASPEPPIVKVGGNPPTPLGRCEGDCDGDGECDSGLKCFARSEPFRPVPGCSGGTEDASRFDYCVRNSDDFPDLSQVGANPSAPLERCEGDCDSDSDCASSDLFCFTRSDPGIFVPGCSGGESDTSKFDYCIRRVDVPPGVAPGTPDPTPDPSPDPTPDPSPAPVSSPTGPSLDEIPIVKVGGNPPTPLGRCEGDCDGDGECDSGLKCFARSEPFRPVPGCSGGAEDASRFDYCVRNSDNFPELTKVGANPSAPLERCEGDCDSDSDCASSDLFCFIRRDPDVFVPGCRGGESDDSLFDYCIRRVDAPPSVAPSPNPTLAPVSAPTGPSPTPPPTPAPVSSGDLPLRATYDFPLGRCEGDCDDDPDCEDGLYCFQRGANEPVPGCSGGSSDRSRTDYCIPENNPVPTPPPTPSPVPAPTSPSQPGVLPLSYSTNFPLGRCVGDCDRDGDCESGLYCFQRDSGDSVPGCSGGSSDHSRTDYCIPAGGGSSNPPLRYSEHFPLGLCVGDCDRDGDCESGLYCFQRDEYESVPGCSGGSSDSSKVDYCIPRSRSSRQPLRYSEHFPLGLCEGDCDDDHDCESGLRCFQRGAHESVPGCSGGSSDASRTDYCIYN
eukprot:scaffold624_cov150-Cylindrotheca_fusiformis.AAC.6